jgi:hypothetical protein
MTRMLVLLLGALASCAVARGLTEVPDHLRDRPSDLYVRVNDKIVKAPPELLKLARTYPSFAGKGEVRHGRRITIIAEKSHCKVGEPVRVIHVLEADGKGVEVHVMGPKPVYDEYVDGENACPRPRDAVDVYCGRVLPSPAVDFHYDVTAYTFTKPGRHTIQWKGGGDPIEGDLGIQSNVLTINVAE